MTKSNIIADESIREVIRSPAVQAIILDKIEEVFSTPEGLVIGLVVNKEKIKQNIMPSIENAGKDIVPLVSQLIRNSEVNNSTLSIIIILQLIILKLKLTEE